MAKIKEFDFEAILQETAFEEEKRFKDLFFNQMLIDGIAEDQPTLYVMEKFFEYGYLIALKLNNKWYLVKQSGEFGIDKFGYPDRVNVCFENGTMIRGLKLNRDAFIIRFTPTKNPLELWLRQKCYEIARCDLAINNNLLYSSMGGIYETDSTNVNSMKAALKQAFAGDIAVFASKNIVDKLNVEKNQAVFYGDKFYELKQKLINEVYSRLMGISNTNDKKERQTSFDMNVNEAIDNVYTFIDTFNADCKKYNIPFKMRLNGVIEELYNNRNQNNSMTETEETEIIENITKKEEKENE